jgi:hypothetical protein
MLAISLVTIIVDLFEREICGSGLENANLRPWRLIALNNQHPLPEKVGINFAVRGGRSVGRSVGRYYSHAD